MTQEPCRRRAIWAKQRLGERVIFVNPSDKPQVIEWSAPQDPNVWVAEEPPKNRGGRPKGSKNRPKI